MHTPANRAQDFFERIPNCRTKFDAILLLYPWIFYLEREYPGFLPILFETMQDTLAPNAHQVHLLHLIVKFHEGKGEESEWEQLGMRFNDIHEETNDFASICFAYRCYSKAGNKELAASAYDNATYLSSFAEDAVAWFHLANLSLMRAHDVNDDDPASATQLFYDGQAAIATCGSLFHKEKETRMMPVVREQFREFMLAANKFI